MKTNTIAILGGTGKSGKYLLQHLLKEGYPVKLLLRHPENFKINNPLITIVPGDARNFQDLNSLIKDCDVVISTLGQPAGEKPVFSDATHNVIKSMLFHEIKRYIITTGLSVDTPFDHKSTDIKAATDWMYQNYPDTTKDKQKEYNMLSESSLNWTMVRLPWIIQTSESFKTGISLEDCKGENVSATDLALFLISQIGDKSFYKQSPFLYTV